MLQENTLRASVLCLILKKRLQKKIKTKFGKVKKNTETNEYFRSEIYRIIFLFPVRKFPLWTLCMYNYGVVYTQQNM